MCLTTDCGLFHVMRTLVKEVAHAVGAVQVRSAVIEMLQGWLSVAPADAPVGDLVFFDGGTLVKEVTHAVLLCRSAPL